MPGPTPHTEGVEVKENQPVPSLGGWKGDNKHSVKGF